MTQFKIGRLGIALALAAAASGCGGSSPRATHASSPTDTQTSTVAVAPTLRVSVLSPRAPARAGPTIAVRVTLSGTPPTTGQRFLYTLDRRLARLGGARLVFHDLAPGRHRLEVLSLSPHAAPGVTTFIVRAPRPARALNPVPAPAEVPAKAPRAAPSSANATPTKAAPTPTTPSSAGGIPQNGGGDGDADNSGGPSDGDGNV